MNIIVYAVLCCIFAFALGGFVQAAIDYYNERKNVKKVS